VPMANMSGITGQIFKSLGLTIVYAIVRRRRGYIQVASTPSIGTTFTLFFPCRAARHVKDEKTSENHIKRDFLIGGETILIIDDEELLAKSTSRFLERYGYRTLIATDGQAGLELFNRHRKQIDVVLLDMELPKIDGPTCLAKMMKSAPDVKVIFLTAHFIKTMKWDPTKAGAKALIQKPFDSNELLRQIRDVLKPPSRLS